LLIIERAESPSDKASARARAQHVNARTDKTKLIRGQTRIIRPDNNPRVVAINHESADIDFARRALRLADFAYSSSSRRVSRACTLSIRA